MGLSCGADVQTGVEISIIVENFLAGGKYFGNVYKLDGSSKAYIAQS